MPEKIHINLDIFRKKTVEDFTGALAAADGKPEIGSAAASVGAYAAAMLEKAVSLTAVSEENSSEREYLLRNAGILRKYMLNLVDEDVKCRGPLKKAISENRPKDEFNACLYPASAIVDEIMSMMETCADLLLRAKAISDENGYKYINSSASLAQCAWKCAAEYKLYIASLSGEETFRYVSVRETEIRKQELEAKLSAL